jgi:hypothetical protein
MCVFAKRIWWYEFTLTISKSQTRKSSRCVENGSISSLQPTGEEFTYAPEILAAHIGVILLIINNDGADSWRQRLLTAHQAIREQISKRRKPYLIRVAANGKLTLV